MVYYHRELYDLTYDFLNQAQIESHMDQLRSNDLITGIYGLF